MSNKILAIAIQTKVCLICGKQHKDDSAILIDTRLLPKEIAETREAEMSKPSAYGDCKECKAYKEKGIVLIGFDESKSDFTLKPSGVGLYRTGQYIVVTEEGYKQFPFSQEHIDAGLKHRCMFIPEQFALELIKNQHG
ncbi:MAG: hypothetical protein EKK63_02480 [Acinetobacter sp.]|uniref:hypothetical protein n=1 Tax=Acinetobacter sp. TaxID=472 RepID=UPI000F98FD4B|nr:hypothetical protein [Acinetobacter sp.]RUP42183.1 MAG: hypothetical protein EKK63_02480 [Acinetobacter sp.]